MVNRVSIRHSVDNLKGERLSRVRYEFKESLKTQGNILEILKSLGFHSWYAYTQSYLYKNIKNYITRKPCCCCYKQATTIHYKQYSKDSLTDKYNSNLSALCTSCYNKITKE